MMTRITINTLKVTCEPNMVTLEFEKFPPPWDPDCWHTFGDTLEWWLFRQGFPGRVRWGGNHGEFFTLNIPDAAHNSLIAFLRGWAETPDPPPKLTQPYASIEYVQHHGGGWLAFDSDLNRLLSLTKEGAMELVQRYGVRVLGL